LKSELSPLPSKTSIPLRVLSPKRERKWKTVFERVIELRVDEVLFKIIGHYLFPTT
jgi:hypothetical protein